MAEQAEQPVVVVVVRAVVIAAHVEVVVFVVVAVLVKVVPVQRVRAYRSRGSATDGGGRARVPVTCHLDVPGRRRTVRVVVLETVPMYVL